MDSQQTSTKRDQWSTTGQDKYPSGMQGQSGGTQNTGVPNGQFDLVSVLYHALEGATTYGRYSMDAQQEGDQELAQFFQQAQQEERQRAQMAQQLLGQRVSNGMWHGHNAAGDQGTGGGSTMRQSNATGTTR